MITMIFTGIAVGLLIRAIRMKKFAWALLAFASLAGVYCCIVGAWAIHQDKLWFGVVLLVAGLAALFGATTVIMRWRSKAADEISKI